MTITNRNPWILLLLSGFAACSSAAPSSPDEPPEQATALEEHHIPAAQVSVPPGVAWTPRPVVEPANPIAQTRAMHNPGGVNGDRPPRPVPGLDNAAQPAQLTAQDVTPDRMAAPTGQSTILDELPGASGGATTPRDSRPVGANSLESPASPDNP